MNDLSLAASIKQSNEADTDPQKIADFYTKQFPALFDRSIIENIDTRAKTLKLPQIDKSPSEVGITPQK